MWLCKPDMSTERSGFAGRLVDHLESNSYYCCRSGESFSQKKRIITHGMLEDSGRDVTAWQNHSSTDGIAGERGHSRQGSATLRTGTHCTLQRMNLGNTGSTRT